MGDDYPLVAKCIKLAISFSSAVLAKLRHSGQPLAGMTYLGILQAPHHRLN